jgi:hypothetical protein
LNTHAAQYPLVSELSYLIVITFSSNHSFNVNVHCFDQQSSSESESMLS